jgi:hypothetical protein
VLFVEPASRSAQSSSSMTSLAGRMVTPRAVLVFDQHDIALDAVFRLGQRVEPMPQEGHGDGLVDLVVLFHFVLGHRRDVTQDFQRIVEHFLRIRIIFHHIGDDILVFLVRKLILPLGRTGLVIDGDHAGVPWGVNTPADLGPSAEKKQATISVLGDGHRLGYQTDLNQEFWAPCPTSQPSC